VACHAALGPSRSCVQNRSASDNEEISLLIIDDEVWPNDALVRLLSIDGFRVSCAQTGTDGRARALATSWDVILLDLHLPDVLGITVLSELRRHGLTAPVLVITGWYLDGGHPGAAAVLGAAGFLRKPVAAEELSSALRAAIHAVAAPWQERSALSGRTPAEAGQSLAEKRQRLGREEDEELRSLHARAAGGDALALDRLCEHLLPMLERLIRGRNSHAQRDWVHDSVQDAVMEFRAHVERFDPTRGIRLTSFLFMAARRNLLNRIDAERRRAAREIASDKRNNQPRSATETPEYERDIDVRQAVAAVWAQLTDVERRVFREVLQGERQTRALAEAGQVEQVAVSDQRRAIKRITNRIFQRLRRLRKRS
jgi:RNA polymerase sigma factor (sigma-70 family)